VVLRPKGEPNPEDSEAGSGSSEKILGSVPFAHRRILVEQRVGVRPQSLLQIQSRLLRPGRGHSRLPGGTSGVPGWAGSSQTARYGVTSVAVRPHSRTPVRTARTSHSARGAPLLVAEAVTAVAHHRSRKTGSEIPNIPRVTSLLFRVTRPHSVCRRVRVLRGLAGRCSRVFKKSGSAGISKSQVPSARVSALGRFADWRSGRPGLAPATEEKRGAPLQGSPTSPVVSYLRSYEASPLLDPY